MSPLTIGTTFTTDDSVNFAATYTSASEIVLTLSLDGSGTYYIGAGNGHITNDTGAAFPSFYALLVGAPAGVTFNELLGIALFSPTAPPSARHIPMRRR